MAIVIALLAGAGVAVPHSVTSLMLDKMMSSIDLEFDYKRYASTKRVTAITKDKFKSTQTDPACEKSKSCQALTSMSDREAKLWADAGVTVTRESIPGDSEGRGRITKIEYIDPISNQRSVATTEAEFNAERAKNPGLDKTIRTSIHNMSFNTRVGQSFASILRKAGASKNTRLTGTTVEEMDKSFEEQVAGKPASNVGATLRPVTDEEGRQTGYTDSDGNTYSNQEGDAMRSSAAAITEAERLTSPGILDSAKRGVTRVGSALSIPATLCDLNAKRNAIKFLNKVRKNAQLIRLYAFAAAVAGEIRAGISDQGKLALKIEMLMNRIMAYIDTRETIVDPDSDPNNPRFIPNPDYKKTGMDSGMIGRLFHGDKRPLGERAQRFAYGTGLGGWFEKANQAIDAFLGGRERTVCKVVNNPIVQVAGLAAGLAVAGGTGGTGNAAMAATSIALSVASPYMMGIIADMLSGKLTKDLRGTDLTDAIAIGGQVAGSQSARAGALMPTSAKSYAKYAAETKSLQAVYDRYAIEDARSTPFDISNRYSFVGSIASTLLPHILASHGTMNSAALNMSGVFSAAATTMTNRAYAADYTDEALFRQCTLPEYKERGIAADVTCIPPLAMSEEAMNMDSAKNALWMERSGNIEPNTFPGMPRDNGQPWNYKKFTEICLTENPEEPELWLDECRSDHPDLARKELNDRFATYTLDAQTESDTATPPRSSGTASSSNPLSRSGWVFPTVAEATVTSGYGHREGGDHKGIDLAAPGDSSGKPIYAARAGKVIAAGPANGYGNWIVIDHGNNIYTVYGHMWDDGVMTQVGQQVRPGDQIGKIGSNGQSTGPHLHHEIWQGTSPLNYDPSQGGPIDPTSIVEESHAAAKGGSEQRNAGPDLRQ